MRLRRDWMIGLVLLCACSRPSTSAVPDASPVKQSPASAKPVKSAAARPAPESSKEVLKESPKESPKSADEDLKTEEREANPYSDTVILKLTVTPQVKAQVTWGAKLVGHLAPGSMDTEISRPRGSGPVDLEIKAEGFMPYHTRLYADRNDRINVRLYRVEDAPGLLGYKRSAEKKAPAEEKKKAPEKK
jgi:hypothetical protein